jgi:hypothetical protein
MHQATRQWANYCCLSYNIVAHKYYKYLEIFSISYWLLINLSILNSLQVIWYQGWWKGARSPFLKGQMLHFNINKVLQQSLQVISGKVNVKKVLVPLRPNFILLQTIMKKTNSYKLHWESLHINKQHINIENEAEKKLVTTKQQQKCSLTFCIAIP